MRKLVMRGERPLSWNAFYAGKHWGKRKAEADRVHQVVRAALDPNLPPYDEKVIITVTAYFKSRPQDPCNITAKLYIDGLIGWYIHDDSPKYVSEVRLRSRLDPDDPRVVIEIVQDVFKP